MQRLHNQLNEPTNQNTLKVPIVVEPTNKKCYYKTLMTSVINSQMSPPSQDNYAKSPRKRLYVQ